METRKSTSGLVNFINFVLNLSWYILWICLFMFIILNWVVPPNVDFSVKFRVNERGILDRHEKTTSIIEINQAQGSLLIENPTPGMKIIFNIFKISKLLLIIFITFFLRKIFSTLVTQEPFLKTNWINIR